MQRHLLLLVLAAMCTCAACGDFLDDIKKSVSGNGQTGLDLNLGGDSAKIGVKSDDGNPFYYVECSAGISLDKGFGAGCERKWKPLFYGLIAGGGVLAVLLLSCCCCCCCAPCRKKSTPGYVPVTRPVSTVIVVNSEAPNPMSHVTAGPPKYDVQMLQA